MTTPFPENNGWPYTTTSVSDDYNQVNRFPEWTQLMAAKLFDALGAGPPQPGEPPFDTGRVSDWSIPATGWSDADNSGNPYEVYWRRRDGWHEVYIYLRATGDDRTISSQFLIAQSAALRPSHNALGEWRANQGGAAGGAVLSTSGNLYLQAIPSITVPMDSTIQIHLNPWLD